MKKMKNNAIDEKIGHFDNEIDMTDLEDLEGIKACNIKLQVDCFFFPDGPSMIVLNSGRLLTFIFPLNV